MRLWRKTKSASVESADPDPLRILTEYVLHMSITCLGDEDVTPLYEEYIQDARLGDTEKEELTEVYRSLHPNRSSHVAN